ncbi:DNA-binding protein [Nocardia carnea]|uniref:DNA-binding protein n=1 Tax=Nocardia carnea TaxID=37328 RepID=UPI002453CD75|nr:DNA-binding protein [Nocardia carnea]
MTEPQVRSIVLDCQALGLLLEKDRALTARIEAARRAGVPVRVSVLTIVEAVHGKTDIARLNRYLSRLRVEPALPDDSLSAVKLLRAAGGLHGHKYAIDALVAAMALRGPTPTLVLTPDRDDWEKLCGDRVAIHDV